jgi:SAM-dependent methyltransferase
MPQGWQWDTTLFKGSAAYYAFGRLPYPPGVDTALAAALSLDGHGRLLDVGCGPGTVTLLLAHLFSEAVGLDADADMLGEASHRAAELRITNVRWVHALAEDLPLDLGTFRVATFASSFHWMDRDVVAARIREMLDPDGAFVQISGDNSRLPESDAIRTLVQRYLGSERRAGQGILRFGTAGGEAAVLSRAGFGEPDIVTVPGGQQVRRSADEVVAAVLSTSWSAPHLFGDRLADFERDLRALLGDREFVDALEDVELRIWRRP